MALQNYPEERLELPGITWSWVDIDHTTTHFDLMLYVIEDSTGSSGLVQYTTDLFDRDTIERMAAHFRALLDAITADPDCHIYQLPRFSAADRALLAQWNANSAPRRGDQCVHDLFAQQAKLLPTGIAVEYDGQSLSYAELNRRANQLAACLRDRGVDRDQLIGICMERSLEMVVGVLGALKAGAAYVPLDPNYPRERLQYMLEDAAPRVLLTHDRVQLALPDTSAHIISLDTDWSEIDRYPADNLAIGAPTSAAESLLYVIYTSGSTGRPKGTAMQHGAMVNLIEWHRQTLPAATKRVLQFAAISFDVAFQEIFSTLCSGGTLVLLDEFVRRNAQVLAEFLTEHRIQRLFLPPLMLQSLAEHLATEPAVPTTLQDVIVAGEQLRISAEIVDLFERLSGCRLHNHYGPTETHVVTALTLEGHPRTWPVLPTIGRPISNTQIHVLDAQRLPVPGRRGRRDLYRRSRFGA